MRFIGGHAGHAPRTKVQREAAVHSPPLLFDVLADAAEAYPIDDAPLVELMVAKAKEHMQSIVWASALTLDTDPRFAICANASNACRTAGVAR